MFQSIKQLYGNKLGASDGETGHRFTGNEVEIPVSCVDRISYDESTVFVNLTKEAVEQSPAHQFAPAGVADSPKI